MFFIILLITALSCNDVGKSEKLNQSQSEDINDKSLTINFNFKTNKTDVFKIMMNNIQVDELQKKNVHIFENVVPSSSQDEIIGKFDAGDISRSIHIHLGNKERKEVEIVSIHLSYGENQINIATPEDLDKYFVFNKFIEKDPTSKKLKTIKINGQHNPVFSLKLNLINFLTK